ncbi:T9SS type A sorting domain-containing protein [Flavobacterium sp. JAS]|uniref:T9SS type A sorting domain-containing protein n=1 Tax=Flavobacterium sp. JAS TaxID=2897329 RepID=UPI001E4BAD3B|nr:T9SS type A sorting domain-containing protein [Flavobacterium sp. JAS]MCD0470262.1 T9SS type A sorting domain-containing protein [Flavobacterium sp. JAS]
MKNVKLLFMMSLLFLAEIGFSQNYVTYSSKTGTVTTNSGIEGSLDITISCYGNSSNPVILNQHFLCGDPDGFVSNLASNGLSLTPGQTTTLKFKFKKTVTSDTQKIYKFTTNGSCFQNESEMIKITVNYKNTTAPTTPTDPINLNTIRYNNSTSNYIVDVGESYKWFIGSDMGVNATYRWSMSIVPGGAWTEISGATGKDYLPTSSISASYFRTAYFSSGFLQSNTIILSIIQPLQNNTITLNGLKVEGSIPTGGLGVDYSQYSWYVIDQDGDGSELPDTSQNLILTPATFNRYFNSPNNFILKRMIRSGNQYSASNGILIPHNSPVGNNTITLNGSKAEGSIPTGGLGTNTYQYSWYVIFEDGDSSELPDTSQSLDLTTSSFARYLNSSNNSTIKRMVTSGNQYSPSNNIAIPHMSEIQNNIISISGKNVTGSTPTGGLGDYNYSWAIYYTGDAIDFDETTKNLDLTPHLSLINNILQIDNSAKLVRLVKAVKTSTSNRLPLNSVTTTSLKKENTATIYPNPTSDAVNFTTSSSNNQEMEIIVYSEGLRNAQSVFKGTITPNQIIKWNIPSNYSKGIYYYKVISGNKEVKSGKILYQ